MINLLLKITLLALITVDTFANESPKVWVEELEDGTAVYSDTPSKNMKPFDAKTFIHQKSIIKKNNRQIKEKKKIEEVNFLVNTTPKNNDAIRSNNGDVTFNYELEHLQQTDILAYLYLDNKKYPFPKNSAKLTLNNLNRGTHQFFIRLELISNNQIIDSTKKTFHLLRTSR